MPLVNIKGVGGHLMPDQMKERIGAWRVGGRPVTAVDLRRLASR